MRIAEQVRPGRPVFSFEFFPPKSPEAADALYANVERLRKLDPDFVSVTYGAAGSTRDGTVEVCSRIQNDLEIETMAHMSCVGEEVAGLEALIERLEQAGVENILALRGDPPGGAGPFEPVEGGLAGSDELIALIRARGRTGIGASCFPEIHPEAASAEADIAYAKRKVDAGAEFLITQLFFDNAVFFDWLERARIAGIDVPVFVGVLPVRTFAGIKRMASLCGADIPEPLAEGLAACEGDTDAEREFGIAYAARQCEELLAAGVQGLHFYTLNHADSTMAVLGALRAASPWERAGVPTGR
jgi:methylenetetrahydrofolate reductase (NADPH)